jgi:hypothetical protein
VRSARFDMSTYYSFVFGALGTSFLAQQLTRPLTHTLTLHTPNTDHFDLPDLVAALPRSPSSGSASSGSACLIAGPIDALRRPLNLSEASDAYAFAAGVQGVGLALGACTADPARRAGAITQALLGWAVLQPP